VLLLLAGHAELVHAQYENIPGSQVVESEQDRYGHLEYFGFYASAMESWNFTEELAGFTNLTWIHVGSAAAQTEAIAEILRRVREADDAGVWAVLSIEPFLFKNSKGEPRPDAEIEDFLVELRAQLEAAGLVGSVAMLYPKDEPFREFVNARKPNFYEQYVSGDVYKDIHRDLKRVNALIKLAFPDTPIGVILSGYELHHKFFSIPENYDWVGFDCYDNLFKACDDKSFVQTYRHLLDHMQPHQQLMAVAETWATNENLYRADWPAVLSRRLQHHYEIALNEPRFVAFIPFLWSFDADSETPGLGLNRFGELYDLGPDNAGSAFVELVKNIGMQIKQGEQQYPNLAWSETEDSLYRPASQVRGEILSISGSGVISAWTMDEALPHKNLRMRVLVRDPSGSLVHKSGLLRSNVDDTNLRSSQYFGKAFVGLHGFRYQLPEVLLRDNALTSEASNSTSNDAFGFQVEVQVFSDGLGPDGMELEQLQSYMQYLPIGNQLMLLPTKPDSVAKDFDQQPGPLVPVRLPDFLQVSDEY
jgi:hypothetical protein